MRRALASSLLSFVVLSACQPVPTPAPAADEAAAIARRKAPSAAPVDNTIPIADDLDADTDTAPTPAPTATPVPAGQALTLTGQVRLDAAYLLSLGAGRVITNNGGSVVALSGGSIISANGANLVANNGAGLISDKSQGWRVLSEIAPGTMLPVAGIAVVPVSLKTGETIAPLAFTDETGAYTLPIPKDTEGNVVLLARVPAENAEDPVLKDARLRYDVIVAPKAEEAHVIDEDTAQVAQYLRESFRARLRQILVAKAFTEVEDTVGVQYPGPETARTLLLGVLRTIWEAGREANVDALSDEALDELTQRLADVVQASIDFEAIELNTVYYPAWDGPVEPCIPAMVEIVKKIRQRAAYLMEVDPQYFERQAYLKTANAARKAKGLPPYQIIKPTDLNELVVREYLSDGSVGPGDRVQEVMWSLDADKEPGGGSTTNRLLANANSVTAAIIQVLVFNEHNAKDDVLELIRRAKP